MRRRSVLALALAAAALALPQAAAAAPPASCGAPDPAEVFTGTFSSEQTGSFVLIPFEVPPGTTAVRAWYCHDQPELPTSQLPALAVRHTLDFGFRDPGGFRGWSGSGFSRAITVSPEGFDTTTRGYRPGPIPAGRWHAELGVAAVVAPTQGDADGTVAWRVELRLETDPAFADEPYAPAPYVAAPASRAPGWFAGDLHVHTDQSGDAKRAPPGAVFDAAFGPAGLDFVQATDHNTDTGWREWGRFQRRHPGKLIARNVEITTYRGHVNAPGIRRLVDYRTGPVFERGEDGTLRLLAPARPASALLADVHAAGGVTTINHPTIFDAAIPPFGVLCRGCSWEYSDAETDYARVDAVEVATGPQGLRVEGSPGPNPFTPLALDFYEHAMDMADETIAAVAGSDSHAAGEDEPTDVTGSPVGVPSTMVRANRLSERAIAAGVAAGHTYVRAFGRRSPLVAFEAQAEGAAPAMMGDTLHAPSGRFTVRVTGPGAGPEPLTLVVRRNGRAIQAVPVPGRELAHEFEAQAPPSGADRYGVVVMRGSAIEAVTTPIRLTRDEAPAARVPLKVRLLAGRRLAMRGRRVTVGCRTAGDDVRACAVRLRSGGRTIAAGRVPMTAGVARVRLRLVASAARRLRARGRLHARAATTAVAAAGRSTSGRTVVLLRRGRR